MLVLLLSACGVIFHFFIFAPVHHVYYDEFHYAHIAQNMHHHNVFGTVLKGTKLDPETISNGDYRPGGYPFLLSLGFKLFGESERTIFYLNSFFGFLSVLAVFCIGFLLFDDVYIGFWSALIFNFVPAQLKYSLSGASDISALLFIFLAVLSAVIYLKQRNPGTLYFTSAVIVFSCYLRPENLILFLFWAPFLFREFKSGAIQKKQLINLAYFSVIFLLPLLMQVRLMLKREETASLGSFWSLRHFFINFKDNLVYIFHPGYGLFIAGVFFIFGAINLFFAKRRLFCLLSLWMFSFFFLYSCFFNGNFIPDITADSDRHFLPCLLAFAIFGGYGIYRLLSWFKKNARAGLMPAVCLLVFISLVFNSLSVTRILINKTLSRDVYKEYLFLKKVLPRLDGGPYILHYHADYIISAFNSRSVALNVFVKEGYLPKELFLIKGYWWHKDAAVSRDYEKFLAALYKQHPLYEVRIKPGLKYSIEKLVRK